MIVKKIAYDLRYVSQISPTKRYLQLSPVDVFFHTYTGLILGLHPATGRRRYKLTPSLIGWAQT